MSQVSIHAFVGDDPARLDAVRRQAAESAADLDPLDVASFDLTVPAQIGPALLELTTPPLLSSHRLVVLRNLQALRKPGPEVLALLEDACRRRSPLVRLVVEGEFPAPRQSKGKAPAQPQLGLPEPLELLLRSGKVEHYFRPSPFDGQAQLQAVLDAGAAAGLKLSREQAGELLLRLGPNSDRLPGTLVTLAAQPGPMTMALIRRLVQGDSADPRAFLLAVIRRDRPRAMQLARQLEAAGEGRVAVLRRLQALAWELTVLAQRDGDTTQLGEALGISSGAAFYRRQEAQALPRRRVELTFEAVTALALQQLKPAGKAMPLALQLQQLLVQA